MFNKITRKIKAVGIKKTAAMLARRLPHKILGDQEIFLVLHLDEFDPPPNLTNKQVAISPKESFDQIAPDGVAALREYGGPDFLALIQRRFGQGHRLFLAYHDGALAGGSWLYVGGDRRFSVIPLSTRDATIIASFTFDNMRKKRAYTTTLIHMLDWLRQRGFQRVVASTQVWNDAPRLTLPRLGFREAGRYRRFRLRGRNIIIWSEIADCDYLTADHGGCHGETPPPAS